MKASSNDRSIQVLQSQENFFAIFAHEVRSQLSGALETSTYLRGKAACLNDNLLFHLDAMTGITQSALDAVDNMLGTVKHVAGRLDIRIKKKRSPFLPWLCSITQQFKVYEAIQEKELTIIVSELGEAHITSDLVKLSQIIKNLLNNAFKFSKSRTAIILECRRMNTGLFIAVRNRGTRIPPDKADLLFKPYQSLDHGYAGTGLGLYLAKVYTAKLRGTISVHSNKNSQTTFTVCIPDCISKPSIDTKISTNEKEPA